MASVLVGRSDAFALTNNSSFASLPLANVCGMFTLYQAMCSSENDVKNRADSPLPPYNLHLRAYERVCVENCKYRTWCVFR